MLGERLNGTWIRFLSDGASWKENAPPHVSSSSKKMSAGSEASLPLPDRSFQTLPEPE